MKNLETSLDTRSVAWTKVISSKISKEEKQASAGVSLPSFIFFILFIVEKVMKFLLVIILSIYVYVF